MQEYMQSTQWAGHVLGRKHKCCLKQVLQRNPEGRRPQDRDGEVK